MHEPDEQILDPSTAGTSPPAPRRGTGFTTFVRSVAISVGVVLVLAILASILWLAG